MLFASCGAPPPADSDAHPPVPTWPVGYRIVETRYAPSGEPAARTLPVHVWYPSVDQGELAAVYEVQGLLELEAHDVLAEPIVAEEGPFPVVLYSHGSSGTGVLGHPYGAVLARRGFVVVAPDHVGNGPLDTVAGTYDRSRMEALRPQDVRAVLDDEGGGLRDGLGAAADLDRVLLVGHSFGAYSVAGALGYPLDTGPCDPIDASPGCALWGDPEVRDALSVGAHPAVRGAVLQGPSLQRVSLAEPPSTPVVVMVARDDRSVNNDDFAQALWAERDGAHDRAVVVDGGHYSFVTVCDDLPPELLTLFLSEAFDDGCGPEAPPPAEVVEWLAARIGDVGGHLLRDEPPPDWSADIPRFAEVVRPGGAW